MSSAGGKDLSGDTQIKVTGSMEPEIRTKMLRNMSENVTAKFPVTTPSYSVVKVDYLNDAVSEIFELEASPVEAQLRLQKRRKGEKGRGKNTKNKRLYSLKRVFSIPDNITCNLHVLNISMVILSDCFVFIQITYPPYQRS